MLKDEYDFESHRKRAEAEYRTVRSRYADLAEYLERFLQLALRQANITAASVDVRVKDAESFARKAVQPSPLNPKLPKYTDPMQQISDMAGARVITFIPRSVEDVGRIIREEFDVVSVEDKGQVLAAERRFGYRSVHYIVRLREDRAHLREYMHLTGLVAEIQVRTVLQHAWAEFEHGIQYRSSRVIPSETQRRFAALAGLLEIADREFEAIQIENDHIRLAARESIANDRLQEVELTPDALKTYLDKKLKPDGRARLTSYEYWAEVLQKLGFTNLDQVEECIGDGDDRRISMDIWGAQHGQLDRFEGLLLAGMGTGYIVGHPLHADNKFAVERRRWLKRLEEAGWPRRSYSPKAVVDN